MDESTLKTLISTLQSSRDSLNFWLNLCSFLVVVGVVAEILFVFRIYREEIRAWRRGIVSPPDRPSRLWLIMELLGVLLVSIGVAGEFAVDVKAGSLDTQIREANSKLVLFLEQHINGIAESAKAAADSADRAKIAADEASIASSTAMTLATGARKEADSYKQDIAAAKQQAADAVSRLADAEQRLADATQRELAADVEVNRLKTPRPLSNTDKLIRVLKPLSGTEYTLMTFADQESINLTKEIGNALNAAGWVRKEPKTHSIGGVSYFNVFSAKREDNIPSCIEIGINVHVLSQVPVDVLQSTPDANLPKEVQAAATLHNALVPSISPLDESNVGRVLEVDKDKDPTIADGPVIVCVGKKP